MTKKERLHSDSLLECIPGPVLADGCEFVCSSCASQVKNGILPKNALANGLWVGAVPPELSVLIWAERRLVARVRTNAYIVQVSSGRKKMMSNIVAYQNPTPKIYKKLPPPLADADAVFTVFFLGPDYPTEEDQFRSPLLVRVNEVRAATEWLIRNHIDYYDVEIDEEAIKQYPSIGMPFAFTYSKSNFNRGPENTGVYEQEAEIGTSHGDSPYIIHGLVGSDIVNANWTQMTTIAIQHLKPDDKALVVGHAKEPESIFNNPSLYPQIFPWFFPYGYGGIQNSLISKPISSQAQKAHYLLYFDKRFQVDKLFPIIAFNHEQIQSSAKQSFLLTKKSNVDKV